ncbi:MAG: hypothetical protein ABR567_17870 [Myxococcales bacterium]|nr:hypothetical protein [Myxococcales bacterium]
MVSFAGALFADADELFPPLAPTAFTVVPTTSKLDPRVAALDHEPTEVEAQSKGYATDVLAVELYLPSAAAGH